MVATGRGRAKGEPAVATIPIEERVTRLEANYAHLATKADLQELKASLTRWAAGLLIACLVSALSAAGAAIVTLIVQLTS